MYSLRKPYKWVRERLDDLPSKILPSEAFVLTCFMVEKILRRTLLQLMVSAGFTTEQAIEVCRNIRGLDIIKKHWKYYDPNNRSLTDIIDNVDWEVIKAAAQMRNELVHGMSHKSQKRYKTEIPKLLDALDNVRRKFGDTYGYSGWRKFKNRNVSALHSDPKVKIQTTKSA